MNKTSGSRSGCRTPEKPARRMALDFDRVEGDAGLKDILGFIDRHGYEFVSASQDFKGVYTVFFRRPVA